jgi:hypothetical protein
MAKKIQFDYKQFLLEKGERFGLGLAVGIMALLVILGVWVSLGKSSPLPRLEGSYKDLDKRVQNSVVDEKVKNAKLFTPPRFETDLDPKLAALSEWVTRINMEDDKKRNPVVLGLRFDKSGRLIAQVDVLRAPVRVIDFVPGDFVNTLSSKRGDPQPNKLAEDLRPVHMIVVSAVFPYESQVAAFRRALRIKPGENLTTPPKFLGFYVSRRDTGPDGKEVKLDDVISVKDPKIEGGKNSFRKFMGAAAQLEPWNKKLRLYAYRGLVMPLPALAEGVDYPALTLKDPDKKEDLLPKTAAAKKEDEDKDSTKKGEKLAKGNDAQVVAPLKWDSDDFEDDLKDRLTGKSVKVFDPEAGIFASEVDNKKAGDQTGPDMAFDPTKRTGKGKGKKKKGQEEVKYDNALFRFVDVDVEPGHTYEYLIVLRLANPNYNKPDEVADERDADDRELLSPAHYVPPVKVPDDMYYYSVDENELQEGYGKRDNPAMVGADKSRLERNKPEANRQVAVQMHRWVDRVKDKNFNLGSWLIAERLLLSRGDFIERKVRLQVPRWSKTAEQFLLAGKRPKAPKRPGEDCPEVEFTTKLGINQKPALLVDYYGGRQSYQLIKVAGDKVVSCARIADESAAELLVLTPEGKLTVRDGREDANPDSDVGKERLERYLAWKSWIVRLAEAGEEKKEKKKDNRFGLGDKK